MAKEIEESIEDLVEAAAARTQGTVTLNKRLFMVIVVLAFVFFIFGGFGSTYYFGNKKAWQNEKQRLLDSITEIEATNAAAIEELQNLDIYDYEQLQQLQKARRKIRTLEGLLNDIYTKRYNRAYLDSIADYYTFQQ